MDTFTETLKKNPICVNCGNTGSEKPIRVNTYTDGFMILCFRCNHVETILYNKEKEK